MMVLRGFLCLTCMLVCLTSNAQTTMDGNVLLKYCSAAVQHFNNDKSADMGAALWCLGYITGFDSGQLVSALEQNRLSNRKGERPSYLYCNPQGVTREQKIRIIVKHLQEHPQHLHSPAEILVFQVLKTAFPCQ